MYSVSPVRPLSGAVLKGIACAAMFTDHLAKALHLSGWPLFLLSGIIGRIAFPLFCFLLAEGWFYTRSRSRYIRNLLIFALLSEVPFDLALYGKFFYPFHQNTCLTLLLGLLLFHCLDETEKFSVPVTGRRALQLLFTAAFAGAAWLLQADYGVFGILCLTACYYLRQFPVPALLAGCTLLNLNGFGAPAAFLALLPAAWYSGKRGRQSKYAFYLFYPLHLLLLAALHAFLR
jgi:hypothetical protein